MESRIILTRHGETDANLKHIYQGKSQDYSLNSTGRDQAKLLGRWLKKYYEAPNIVLSSPAKRALETACILHYEIFGHSKEPRLLIIPNLYEINHGKWEGMTDEEVRSEYGGLYKTWQTNPMKLEFPGGESMMSAKQRVIAEFEKIILREEKNILLIGHGGVNYQIMNYVLGSNKLRNIWQDNTCINIIERSKKRLRVRAMNCTAHLTVIQEAQK